LNKLAEKNNGHLALKKLTWADVFVTALSEMIKFGAPDDKEIFSRYPALKKMIDNVEGIKEIKKWIAERPESEY
jgi:hypothetical protein